MRNNESASRLGRSSLDSGIGGGRASIYRERLQTLKMRQIMRSFSFERHRSNQTFIFFFFRYLTCFCLCVCHREQSSAMRIKQASWMTGMKMKILALRENYRSFSEFVYSLCGLSRVSRCSNLCGMSHFKSFKTRPAESPLEIP